MAAPDPKPAKRIKDPKLMRRLHVDLEGEVCERCFIRVGSQLHHVVRRSQGGNDTRANLLWLCWVCHERIHS